MWQKILKYKILSGVFASSAFFILGGTIWAYAALRDISSPLILHFNNISGITQIGGLGDLMWIGATGTVMVIINFFIALEFEVRDRFWGKLVAAATFLFAVLLFVGFAAIISVN